MLAATTRSPNAPPGARRARRERRGRISPIAHAPPRSSRSSTTSSPTASLGAPPCLSRPRSVTSRVTPAAVRTCQTPPVPRRTTARDSGEDGAESRVPNPESLPSESPAARRAPGPESRSSLVIHRLLPRSPLRGARADLLVEKALHLGERERPDGPARLLRGRTPGEEVGLDVPADLR